MDAPITNKPPFINVQGIYANIKEDKCLSNKRQGCESMPVIRGTRVMRYIYIKLIGARILLPNKQRQIA